MATIKKYIKPCVTTISINRTNTYKQRFYRVNDNIITILKVGIHYNTTDIAGICYHSKGWQKFEVHTLSKYAKEEFDKVINAVNYKIKNS